MGPQQPAQNEKHATFEKCAEYFPDYAFYFDSAQQSIFILRSVRYWTEFWKGAVDIELD